MEFFHCFSRIDGIFCKCDSLFDGIRPADGIKRTAGVQKDNVPTGAGLPFEYAKRNLGILLGGAPDDLREV